MSKTSQPFHPRNPWVLEMIYLIGFAGMPFPKVAHGYILIAEFKILKDTSFIQEKEWILPPITSVNYSKKILNENPSQNSSRQRTRSHGNAQRVL